MRTATIRAAARTTGLLSLLAAHGCQGSTGGSAPPPASATAAAAAQELPPAGPPAPTANPGEGVPAASSGPGNTPDPTKELAAGTVSVAQISAMPAGSKATVRGLYLGWRGPCQGPPPTRSAWQLADNDQKGAACLYVDGPPPAGVDLAGRGAPVWVRVDAELVAAGPSMYLTAQHADRETP